MNTFLFRDDSISTSSKRLHGKTRCIKHEKQYGLTCPVVLQGMIPPPDAAGAEGGWGRSTPAPSLMWRRRDEVYLQAPMADVATV